MAATFEDGAALVRLTRSLQGAKARLMYRRLDRANPVQTAPTGPRLAAAEIGLAGQGFSLRLGREIRRRRLVTSATVALKASQGASEEARLSATTDARLAGRALPTAGRASGTRSTLVSRPTDLAAAALDNGPALLGDAVARKAGRPCRGGIIDADRGTVDRTSAS